MLNNNTVYTCPKGQLKPYSVYPSLLSRGSGKLASLIFNAVCSYIIYTHVIYVSYITYIYNWDIQVTLSNSTYYGTDFKGSI